MYYGMSRVKRHQEKDLLEKIKDLIPIKHEFSAGYIFFLNHQLSAEGKSESL